MKQLLSLFLFLLPCLAWAQYPSNGNQKITLGEQTTADGLIYRGVLGDTLLITPSSDTSAYIILDTVNHRFYNYNRATNVWSVAGGGTAVTTFSAGTTGLTPSTATSGAVTLAGTLAVANGGTGSATQNFVDLTTTQTVAGAKTFSNAATFSSSVTTSGGGFKANMGATNTSALIINRASTSANGIIKFENNVSDTWILGNRNTSDETFRLYNYNVGADVLTIDNSGNFGIGNTTPTYKLDVNGTSNFSNILRVSTADQSTNRITLFNQNSGNRWDIVGGLNGVNNTDFSIYDNTNNVTVLRIVPSTGAATFSSSLGVTGVATFNTSARFNASGNWMEFTTNVLTSNSADGAHIRSVSTSPTVPTYAWSGDQNTGMYNPSANNLGFVTDGVERVRINEVGELGIGYGATDNGAYPLQVNGQIFATNATIATPSDISYKENIQPLDKGLEIINKLKPKKFNFISTTLNNFSEFEEVGFIAQDVEGALSTELFAKSIVKKSDESKEDSTLVLMTQNLIPILTKAIQEQQAIIKALEQRIINLENK